MNIMTKKVNFILGTMTFGESVFDSEIRKFLDAFFEDGYEELDTAYVYNEGRCEKLLGAALKNLSHPYKIATKVNPRITGRLDGEAASKQLKESLKRLGVECVDIFYLHFPDPFTPVESVLETCNILHNQGKFKELGLSNFPSWMVADIWHKCDKNRWVKPTVYEGIYNPLTRKAEIELNMALYNYGMRFYAYNPMAGGLLTGQYGRFEDLPTDGRFIHRPNYQKRYWKKSFFDAIEVIKTVVEQYDITTIEAVYRWLAYHSMLNGDRGDAIIIGASKLEHLKQNMKAVKAGPLPEDIVNAFSKAWEISKSDSPEYFTLFKGKN